MRAIAGLALLAALGLVPACITIRPATPDSENLIGWHQTGGTRAFQRVVLPPLRIERADEEYAELFQGSFARALSRSGRFEVIPVSADQLKDIELDLTRTEGRYRTKDLIQLSQRFGADGAIAGVVSTFRAYPSMVLGVRIHLLDCRTGEVAWATDTTLDTADRRVVSDVHNYHDVHLDDRESLVGHRIVLRSPRLFFDYSATRIVETLDRALAAPQ